MTNFVKGDDRTPVKMGQLMQWRGYEPGNELYGPLVCFKITENSTHWRNASGLPMKGVLALYNPNGYILGVVQNSGVSYAPIPKITVLICA